MEPFFDAQLPFIQSLGHIGWLELPMRAASLLGEETFFLLLVPLLYWCVNARLGMRVGLVLLLSTSLNSALKLLFSQPRPYWYAAEVTARAAEPSFALPSAHAQNAAAVWGVLAAWSRRRWAWATALALVLLIGISRVYLGVHFPTDVLAGWAAGALVLWAFLAWFDTADAWFKERTLGAQAGLALASALLLLAPSVLLALRGWQMPLSWGQNALAAFPGELPQPLSLDTPVASAGTWFGFGAGVALLARGGTYIAGGELWRRAVRYLFGMIVVLVLWAGLRAVFPDDGSALAYTLRFVRYALVGAWIAAGAPVLFQKLGLAHQLVK